MSLASSARRLLPNLVLAGGSLGLALMLLEAYARRDLRRPQGKQNERAAYTDFHPVLGWTKRPGARVTYRRPEYTVEVAINSHGLRDPERSYEASGALRILALGDSFIEGYSVALEETMTQVLERRLRDAGCHAEVLNGGTGGYSSDQEYLFYREEGMKYGPQIVGLFFFGNDVPNNARSNYFGAPKPYLVATPEGLRAKNLPLQRPAEAPHMEEHVGEDGPAEARAWVSPYWIQERLRRSAPGTYNRLAHLGLWAPLRGEPPDAYLAYALERSETVRFGWRLTEGVLRAFKADVEGRGGHFFVAYIPNRIEVDDRAWELTREVYGMQGAAWDRELVERRLRRIAGSAKVDVLSLTPALRRAEGGFGGPMYFARDGHWNARGHRLAAETVDAFVRERGWLSECGRQRGYTLAR